VLHDAARFLQRPDRTPRDVLGWVLEILTDTLRCREPGAARAEFGRAARATAGYRATPWTTRAEFETTRGTRGCIEVAYPDAPPEASEEASFADDQGLVRSLAEMLRAYFEHQEADAELTNARDLLEETVRERTEELRVAKSALEAQHDVHRRDKNEITRQSARLRELAREVALAEERQRRAIALDLHDHLGQALAFIRMQLSDLQGDVVFSGFEGRIEGITSLLDKAIAYTRTLTAQISPPVLYELGFQPAVAWLADQVSSKHGLPVRVHATGDASVEEEAGRIMLFLAVRELLINAVKHSNARRAEILLDGDDDTVRVEVRDDGEGFDPEAPTCREGFGLFSIAERIRSLGGTVHIDSAPGTGTRVALTIPRGKRAG
jgi:signal transduction histidine kinase